MDKISSDLRKIAIEIVSSDNKFASHELNNVADLFTQYLIGDREIALKKLQNISKEQLFSDETKKLIKDSKEYNKMYSEIYNKLFNAIKSI